MGTQSGRDTGHYSESPKKLFRLSVQLNIFSLEIVQLTKRYRGCLEEGVLLKMVILCLAVSLDLTDGRIIAIVTTKSALNRISDFPFMTIDQVNTVKMYVSTCLSL